MKKVILYAVCALITVSSFAAAPDSKIVSSFNQTFPNAKNIKWRDDKAGYFVSFEQNGNFNKVFYNTDGNLVYALKYCNADGLPTNIAMELTKKYGESSIEGVTAVTTQNNMFYNVKLSKEQKLYDVNIMADGSIAKEVVYDKGSN